MRARRTLPLLLAMAAGALVPAGALAAPATVTVRIEGRTQTLFEGPLLTDGHGVRASSDTVLRRCDGTNNNANPAAGPTGTAAAADAMRVLGLDFDARWFPAFDDYFIQRFGPDAEDANGYAYWGILLNGVLTQVGGCQQRVRPGQELLWAYDAFRARPFLRLARDGDDGAVPEPILTVDPGAPLRLRVVGRDGSNPAVTPAEGVPIVPVTTGAYGFQSFAPASLARSAADGTATVTFTTPGWQRIKAVDDAGHVRSNRIDVCVVPPGMAGCGPAPADTVTRIPPPPETPPADPPREQPRQDSPRTGQPPSTAAPRLEQPRIVLADGARRGLVGVRWRVLDAGVGVRGWEIAAKTLGSKRASFVTSARGGSDTRALLRLPAGVTSQLRFSVTDALGRTTSTTIGNVVVPRDDRALGLRRSWRAARDATAWLGTATRGAAGARLTTRLAAGRPVFFLRGGAGAARVEVRAAGRAETFTVAAGRAGTTRELKARRRAKAGSVELRVLRGSVSVDGVAATP
ncbi:hypothetical protein [Conexibacter woesei]|uniref:hypothetical protein n=1 Tax=Conexibacter woesei TaxID=191495 RepID=UPI0002F1CB48|nr:hypothetical protein [Conexibacter woesei]